MMELEYETYNTFKYEGKYEDLANKRLLEELFKNYFGYPHGKYDVL